MNATELWLDAAKVREAADRVAADHPHWVRTGPAGDVDQGRGEPAPAQPSNPFGQALKAVGGR